MAAAGTINSFLRQKELQPSSYLRAETTGLWGIRNSCYPFLQKRQ